MRFRVAELAADLGATLVGAGGPADVVTADLTVSGVGIDSRSVAPGELFVAISGDRDGHEFVGAALDAGAYAALVERPVSGAVSLVVPDTVAALATVGVLARGRLTDRVVGITGSVGKTTTKDLLAGALRTRFATAASDRSFNNELGVPLTLANASTSTEVAVIEMGSRGIGHIAQLCRIARPTIGIITAVAAVHTETFGDIEGVAVAKRELVEALPPDGLAVLNRADTRVTAMASHTSAEVITFGTDGDVRAEGVTVDHDLFASFVIESAWGSAPVRLGVRGIHNVPNALAAASVALWLGIGVEQVAAGLAQSVPSPWRMELGRGSSGVTVLNDAYNAGPMSMAAALRSLAALPAGRRVAILGLMAELGADEEAEHRRVSALADELEIEIVAVGTPLYGVEPLADSNGLLEAVGPLDADVAVLVKGSRVAGLERLAAALLR